MKLKKKQQILIHAVLLLGVGIMVLPFLWMVLTSFKTQGESMQMPPVFWPQHFNFDSYRETIRAIPFAKNYMNTIVSTVITTAGQVGFCTLAAYSFARITFPFKNILFVILLSVLMIPGQIFLIPQYQIIQKLGLLNSMPALFIPNLFSAFGTFMMRQFFMSLPVELEEAAMLDGCNRLQIFTKVTLPLVKAGIVSLSIFTVKFAWNDFMWPLIVNTSPGKMTLAPALASLQDQYVNNFPSQMAGAVMAVLPLVIMFFIFQKQFIEGVAHSSIKG